MSATGYDADLLRGNTEVLLLYLIGQRGEAYGYQLIKDIETRSCGFFHFREGTVYPALRKLENEGLLGGQWRRLTGGQERRYYRITPSGAEFLKRRLAMWQSFTMAMQLVFNGPD